MINKFKVGETVAVSAAFLRSIDPSAAKGWPTRYDHGKGVVSSVLPCGDFDLVEVKFNDAARTYNSNNLVHECEIYNEAMRAEHAPRLNGTT